MLIGENFEKIQFELFGLELLEPNAFIGDTLLFLVAHFFAIKTYNMGRTLPFFTQWTGFFLLFGIGFFFGGLGHLFYNYWGIPGKTPSWFLGVAATYFIERAMISLVEEPQQQKRFSQLSNAKFILACLGVLLVTWLVDLESDYSKGMIVPTLNSTIGLVFALGYLGYTFSKKIVGFKWFWMSVLILFPAALLQGFKINLHPWFDKNDFSHLLLIISLFFYYQGIKAYNNYLEKQGFNAE